MVAQADYIPAQSHVQWLRTSLAQLNEGGLLALPMNQSVYAYYPSRRVLVLSEGPKDDIFDKTKACGERIGVYVSINPNAINLKLVFMELGNRLVHEFAAIPYQPNDEAKSLMGEWIAAHTLTPLWVFKKWVEHVPETFFPVSSPKDKVARLMDELAVELAGQGWKDHDVQRWGFTDEQVSLFVRNRLLSPLWFITEFLNRCDSAREFLEMVNVGWPVAMTTLPG